MSRIISLIIGYAFGLFQTGYLYGRLNNIDIRDYGSGNAGTTNAMRTLGKKAGIITYLGDCFKAILSAVVVHILFGNNSDCEMVLLCYSGLGVVLGHNFPFYLNFKGGKGIAASSGVILSFLPYNFLLTIFALLTFVSVTCLSRYVSLGSLVLMLTFFLEFIFFGVTDGYGMDTGHIVEACFVIFVITALAFIRHRENIKRLLNGTERRIGEKRN